MIDSLFRRQYQKVLVDPIAQNLEAVTPLKLTILSCFFGSIVCPLLAFDLQYVACASLILSGYFDTLDGSVARRFSKTSSIGAVLDIVSDRFVEFSVIMGLYAVDPVQRALPALLMLGTVLLCITSFLVVGIMTPNESEKGFYYSPGIMERAEAFILWMAMMLLPQLFSPLAYAFSLLVALTTVIRLAQFYKAISRKQSQKV